MLACLSLPACAVSLPQNNVVEKGHVCSLPASYPFDLPMPAHQPTARAAVPSLPSLESNSNAHMHPSPTMYSTAYPTQSMQAHSEHFYSLKSKDSPWDLTTIMLQTLT